jgi:Heavy metal binding domain
MNQSQREGQIYFCPMHSSVRQSNRGKCPKCGMELLREGTRFAMFRHVVKNPVMLTVMVLVMVAIMAAIMMMVRR